MLYNFQAIVNYPGEGEIETPLYERCTSARVAELVKKMIDEEKDGSSFVITVARL